LQRIATAQSASGPFSHSGIGELKPTLRFPARIDSGIRPVMARLADIARYPNNLKNGTI
jgi:hypothetical protein